jgi:hypothetical protein
MNRDGALIRILCTTALVLGLGAGTAAQEGNPAANAPASAEQAAPQGEQASRRDRRRNAEAAAETAGAPTAAAEAAAAPTAAADPAAPTEPKMVCKNIKPIGSRVARRTCATEEQWAASRDGSRADAQEGMRQVRDRSGITGGVGAGPASLGNPSMQ